MREEVSIEGRLLMLDDATPHVAVPVQAIRDGEVIATRLSDRGGRYQFMDLMPGCYHLRCQVLGGYVYYGEEKAREPESQKAGGERIRGERERGGKGKIKGEGPGKRGDGDMLKVEAGKALENIDFRFAPFKKGIWRKYTQFDGLPHSDIKTIHHDPDGTMWFGTGGGVSHYDGQKFVNLTPKDGLVHNEVWAIHRNPDGVMWFGTHRGISRYDGEEFVNFIMEGKTPTNWFFDIHRDPDGVMWFAGGAGISRYDGGKLINLTTEGVLAHGYGYAYVIYRDPDGIMWIGTDSGVFRYDGKEFVNFTTKDGLAHNYVFSMYYDIDGVMWFGTNGGVSRYDGRGFVNFTTEDGLAHNTVYAMHRDLDGVMWFGTVGGISRYDGEGFVNFTVKDGLAHSLVWAVYCAPDDVIWFGTHEGLSFYDRKKTANFTAKDGLMDNNINVVYCDPDGVMWFGTNGGVYRYDVKKFVNFTTEDGLAHNHVCAIHRDPDGIMWFGTNGGGVSCYDGKEFVNFTTKNGLTHNFVNSNSIYRDPDGVMWIGTDGGVSRYNGKEFVNFTTEDGLPHDDVTAIHRDSDGSMWFGMQWGGGVSRYDGKEFVNFSSEDGLVHEWVNTIYRDRDGTMWVGTRVGTFFHEGEGDVTFAVVDELAYSWVTSIYQDLDGKVWFATRYGGAYCYNGSEWTSLDVRDGLASNDVRSICRDADGTLWFGTSQGITRYRPGSNKPATRILSVTTDQIYRFKTQGAGRKTEEPSIPAFTIGTRVTIEYDSIDFKTIPEKRQYRCRVYKTQDARHKTQDEEIRARDSLESGVLSPGSGEAYLPPTKSTTFDWTPEEPGTYVFEVQAIDRDLNYSEPASVRLEVIPDPRNHRIIQLEEHIHQQELAELERVHRELEDAMHIQQSLLPEQPPRIEGFEIAGASIPAREVSGDFYDYLVMGENTGIALADVTGKSVKAAMIAAMANGMLHAEVRERVDVWDSPGMILRQLNTGLRPRLSRGMFTAMSLGVLQVADKRLLFSNAGMMYPVVKRGKRVWEVKVNGMPLGLMEGAEYEDLSLDLKRGDLVVFYSDGIIEAENEAGEMYQTERLLELMQRADPGLSAQDMVDLIVRDVTAFVGEEESSDDITIVVLSYKNNS